MRNSRPIQEQSDAMWVRGGHTTLRAGWHARGVWRTCGQQTPPVPDLRLIVYVMVMTILPLWSPLAKSRNASGTSASSNGPSITGTSLPASNSSFM